MSQRMNPSCRSKTRQQQGMCTNFKNESKNILNKKIQAHFFFLKGILNESNLWNIYLQIYRGKN